MLARVCPPQAGMYHKITGFLGRQFQTRPYHLRPCRRRPLVPDLPAAGRRGPGAAHDLGQIDARSRTSMIERIRVFAMAVTILPPSSFQRKLESRQAMPDGK